MWSLYAESIDETQLGHNRRRRARACGDEAIGVLPCLSAIGPHGRPPGPLPYQTREHAVDRASGSDSTRCVPSTCVGREFSLMAGHERTPTSVKRLPAPDGWLDHAQRRAAVAAVTKPCVRRGRGGSARSLHRHQGARGTAGRSGKTVPGGPQAVAAVVGAVGASRGLGRAGRRRAFMRGDGVLATSKMFPYDRVSPGLRRIFHRQNSAMTRKTSSRTRTALKIMSQETASATPARRSSRIAERGGAYRTETPCGSGFKEMEERRRDPG